MTVKITAFAGAEGILYFTRGEGCGGHDHGLRGEHGVGPEQYFVKGQEGNPVGVWHGAGAALLGLEAGAPVREKDAEAVFGQMANPVAFEAFMATAEERIAAEGLTGAAAAAELEAAAAAARLGGRGYRFKTLEERVKARVKAERVNVDLDQERVRAIELEEAAKATPKARNFYDVTFSPSKSSSVYYAGLIASERRAEAERMREIHREAVAEALEYFQQEAGYARAGHHGKAPDGRPSVGRWVDAHEWVMSLWDHQTNREGEPQLHTHALVLNRVRTVTEDGTEKWRALDGASLYRAQRAAAAIYERGFEQRMEAEFPVAYRLRPDGKARELVGISEEERAALSTRAAQVSKKVEKWAAEYEARTGQAPSPYARTLMQQDAARITRERKKPIGSESELLRQWETMVGQRLKTTLAAMAERAEAAAIDARGRGDADRWERHVVIGQAIERVQSQRSTWTRADLMFAINEVLPDRLGPSVLAQRGYTTALLEELADEALSGRYGVVMVQGMELIPVPEEFRRADGRSVYQPSHGERYATLAYLDAEQRVISRAKARGALALSQAAIADALEEAAQGGRPLGDDQANVVAGVLGDARPIDVVVGPAGAGKSTAQGTIARAWEATGRRVIGLAPSSKAAQVLQAQGLTLAMNIDRFLMRAKGQGPRHEVDLFALRPGDMVVLDEAGMASTEHIVQISKMVEAVGGKLVLCGDDAQLAAVEAGGLFRELARMGEALQLDTVRRFRDEDGTVREWEARASLGLREGRVHALDAYRIRGRIQSGTVEEMAAAIQRSYVADQLRGVHSVVMTSTEEQATNLSAAIRAELAALGKVEAAGVELANGTLAGVGDLIQTRENINNLTDSAGMAVFNRYLYRVASRSADGSLTVDRVTGRDEQGAEQTAGRVTLPADYVAEHVTLGYAGTIHSVQGDTVKVGYGLVTSAATREQMYVEATRGSLENFLFVGLERDEEELSVLAGVLANTGAERSASETLRTELEWIESLGAHAPVWEDLVEQHQRTKHQEILAESLGEELYERLRVEDPSTVYRQLWAAELAGHDARALVADALGSDGLGAADTVDKVPSLLFWRIDRQLKTRTPEREPAGASWVERTPADLEGPAGELARARAEAMDARVQALGERAVQEPPAWALERLGPVPEDLEQRAEWQQRVAAVEAYREQYQVEAPSTVIGPPPGRGMVTQYAAWEAAYQAMGRTAEEQRLAEASAATLREQVEIWQREQEWAPPSVAEELARVTEQRRTHEQEEALARAQAELVADPEQRVRLSEQAEAARVQAERVAGLGAAIEERHAERESWYERTAALREQAEAALSELIRRKVDQPERQAEPEAEAQRQAEPEAGREPSQYEREREAFTRLADHWSRQQPLKRIDVERQAEPEAGREPSQREREREAFTRLAAQWDAREQQAAPEITAAREPEQTPAAPQVSIEELRPQVSLRVLTELWEAQQRTVQPEAPTVRERTERAEAGRTAEAEPTLRQQIEAQLSERREVQERLEAERAARREIEPERSMQEITRDHHYHQQALELEAEQSMAVVAERGGPVIEGPGIER
ncbi:MobF family relaxase [Streptosporangium sp. NPDC048047]|uniref:MobF family relaxase n=1 Tax=Streptosporangium sp. NPDC048047 TaxID=3155748 RepID=UPI00343C53AC